MRLQYSEKWAAVLMQAGIVIMHDTAATKMVFEPHIENISVSRCHLLL